MNILQQLGISFASSSGMSRKPRQSILADGSYYHAMWRCHNRDWLLKSDWTKQLYYNFLSEYKEKYAMVFFSYHFMDNHIHLTGKVSSLENFSRFFRLVNNLFSKKFNKEHHRYGQTVMQRFLSPRIKDDQHMLAVIAYIDLNSVRAGKHSQPEDSSWSSYKYYAYGQTEPLIEVAPFYLGLGKSGLIRQRRYRELVKIQLFCWW